MPLVHANQPGMFSWIELATTDKAAALRFYQTLLGWSYVDMGADYVIAKTSGGEVGGVYAIGEHPHWLPYVAVEDIEAMAKQIATLGGRVTMGPKAIDDGARLVWAEDPTGGAFAVFQPAREIGARVANELGAASWIELLSRDTAAAEQFYTRLFGWTTEKMSFGPTDYTVFKCRDAATAGMVQIPLTDPNAGPSNWLAYFDVADCDASVATVKATGGQVFVSPLSVSGVGRFAVLADPQGALFGLLQPERR